MKAIWVWPEGALTQHSVFSFLENKTKIQK